MASGTAKVVYHGTLTATTVDTVTLSQGTSAVEVYNRAAAGGADIYVTTTNIDPTVGGNDCYIITPQTSDLLPTFRDSGNKAATVKIISSGTPSYSVTCR